jgi:RHS repeat-associated protein
VRLIDALICAADRLVSTTAAGYGSAISYDNHGNTTALGGDTLSYDGADRHVSTVQGATSVTYTRDASDRIVSRTAVGPNEVAPAFKAAGVPSNNGTTATTITVNNAVGTTTGDLLVATVGVASTVAGTSAPTVATPSGWTLIASSSNPNGQLVAAFYKFAAAGDPVSWTFTLSASGRAVGAIVAYTGVDPTTPIDVSGTAVPNVNPFPAPQVTTTGTNRTVLTLGMFNGLNAALTPASGTIERFDALAASVAPTGAIELADSVQASAGLTPLRSVASAGASNAAMLTIALRPVAATGTSSTVQRYSYSGGADATALTLSSSNVILDVTISLPGGLVLTKTGATQTWAYPNIHGDVTYTVDQAGVKTGPFLYDPYGQPLTGVANTSPGEMDNGWLGQHQRPYEHQPGINPLTEMGARPYSATLGRFLRIDPIPGGATDSDYGYVSDPVNKFDISGECGTFGNPFKKCKKGRKGNPGFLGGTFTKIARHATVGYSGCLVVCAHVTFQAGKVNYGVGGTGFLVTGPSVGWNSRKPSEQQSGNLKQVGACVAYFVMVCGNRGNPNWGTSSVSPGAKPYWSVEVGPGFGASLNTGDWASGGISLW